MPASLRPLVLPQLVNSDKLRKSLEAERPPSDQMTSHTPTSSFSDLSTPPTPTFSIRGHSRLPSSTSTVDTTVQSISAPSASSPTVPAQNEVIRSPKRSLPDVEEEHEDYDMFDETNAVQYCSNFDHDHSLCARVDESEPSMFLSTDMSDYDLADGFTNRSNFSSTPIAKKRRSGDSPLVGLASRLSNRFPSISRRWRSPTLNASKSAAGSIRENAPSRSASTRSPSLYHPESEEIYKFPPTPTSDLMAFCDDQLDSVDGPENFSDDFQSNKQADDHRSRDGIATTPLLPPLMVPETSQEIPEFQSPLQSPTVCTEGGDCPSITNTPSLTPHVNGVPSPPLSTRPSICSFRPQTQSPQTLVPSSEIPPMLISEPSSAWEREWATRLGHANFTPLPEPYILLDTPSPTSIQKLRDDYDAARTSYTRHLIRTGEHYGTTSTTYHLSEEKWAEIDCRWRKALDGCQSPNEAENTVSSAGLTSSAMIRGNSCDAVTTVRSTTKIPPLVDNQGQSKFPTLGDGEVVGPMIQYASQLPQKPSRRATFLKFLQDVKFPRSILNAKDKPQ